MMVGRLPMIIFVLAAAPLLLSLPRHTFCYALSSSSSSSSRRSSSTTNIVVDDDGVVVGKETKKSKKMITTTIAVCTGPDCRVDGASDCIRKLQKTVSAAQQQSSSSSSSSSPTRIRVTGRNCIGPCGDGPCVMITSSINGGERKIIEEQPSKKQIALVEPDLFASNPKGWYQVRTNKQVDEVMDIAYRAAGGVDDYKTLLLQQEEKEQVSSRNDDDDDVFVTSTRAWFDRPRNERKVLQRLMQVLVLAGLYSYDKYTGELGNQQYAIAFGLFVISDFIMKENTWTILSRKVSKSVKK